MCDFSLSVHLVEEAYFYYTTILQTFTIITPFAGKAFVWNFIWKKENVHK